MTPLDKNIRKELVGLGVLAAVQSVGIVMGCGMAVAAAVGSWISFIGAAALLHGDTDLWPRWEALLMVSVGLIVTFALGTVLIWSARIIGRKRRALSPNFKARRSILGMLQIAVPMTLYAFAVFALLTHAS